MNNALLCLISRFTEGSGRYRSPDRLPQVIINPISS